MSVYCGLHRVFMYRTFCNLLKFPVSLNLSHLQAVLMQLCGLLITSICLKPCVVHSRVFVCVWQLISENDFAIWIVEAWCCYWSTNRLITSALIRSQFDGTLIFSNRRIWLGHEVFVHVCVRAHAHKHVCVHVRVYELGLVIGATTWKGVHAYLLTRQHFILGVY